MAELLMTGISGLIGRHVLALLGRKWEVFALVREPHDGKSGGICYIDCDLTREKWTGVLPARVDAVIHLAQSEHFREFPQYAKKIFQVNTMSVLHLLEYARFAKAKTFVLASSGGIYGHGDEGFKEDDPIAAKDDLGFYLSTKLCAEVLAENYSSFMNIIILRFFFVYGPGQRPGMLIPRIVSAVRKDQAIRLQGQDGLKLNPTYVTDAAVAVCRSLGLTKSHKINVGGPEVLSLRQIGQQIGKVLRRTPVFKVQENIQPLNIVGDIQKMSNLLGRPGVGFGEGIAKYIEASSGE